MPPIIGLRSTLLKMPMDCLLEDTRGNRIDPHVLTDISPKDIHLQLAQEQENERRGIYAVIIKRSLSHSDTHTYIHVGYKMSEDIAQAMDIRQEVQLLLVNTRLRDLRMKQHCMPSDQVIGDRIEYLQMIRKKLREGNAW